MEALIADSSFEIESTWKKQKITTKRKTLASNTSTENIEKQDGRLEIRHTSGNRIYIYISI